MRGQYSNRHSICGLRRQHGWTQDELATHANCDVKTVRKAERGQRLDLESLRRIAKALKVSFSVVVADQNLTDDRSNAVVEQWLIAFHRRDLPDLLSLYGVDATLKHPGPDTLPFAGVFRGQRALRRHFEQLFECFHFAPADPAAVRIGLTDMHILLRLAHRARSRHNRKQFDVLGMHELQIDNGRIVHHLALVDTNALAAALMP